MAEQILPNYLQRVGLEEKFWFRRKIGCFWIKQLYLFSPPPSIPLLGSLSSLSSTILPSSFNTHKPAYRVAKETVNVILNCYHSCWARTSEKGTEKNDIKNKYV